MIIQVEDKKEYQTKFNLDDKIEQIIKFKTNEQLNQFSNIFLNKIKKDVIINEL